MHAYIDVLYNIPARLADLLDCSPLQTVPGPPKHLLSWRSLCETKAAWACIGSCEVQGPNYGKLYFVTLFLHWTFRDFENIKKSTASSAARRHGHDLSAVPRHEQRRWGLWSNVWNVLQRPKQRAAEQRLVAVIVCVFRKNAKWLNQGALSDPWTKHDRPLTWVASTRVAGIVWCAFDMSNKEMRKHQVGVRFMVHSAFADM